MSSVLCRCSRQIPRYLSVVNCTTTTNFSMSAAMIKIASKMYPRWHIPPIDQMDNGCYSHLCVIWTAALEFRATPAGHFVLSLVPTIIGRWLGAGVPRLKVQPCRPQCNIAFVIITVITNTTTITRIHIQACAVCSVENLVNEWSIVCCFCCDSFSNKVHRRRRCSPYLSARLLVFCTLSMSLSIVADGECGAAVSLNLSAVVVCSLFVFAEYCYIVHHNNIIIII